MQRLFRRLSAACLHFSFSPDREGAGKRKFLVVTISAALLCCLMPAWLGSGLHAQDTTGSIVGTVTDAHGAVIQGAAISAKDVDRGSVLNTRTNESGAFSFSGVPVGNYEVAGTPQRLPNPRPRKIPLAPHQTAPPYVP